MLAGIYREGRDMLVQSRKQQEKREHYHVYPRTLMQCSSSIKKLQSHDIAIKLPNSREDKTISHETLLLFIA